MNLPTPKDLVLAVLFTLILIACIFLAAVGGCLLFGAVVVHDVSQPQTHEPLSAPGHVPAVWPWRLSGAAIMAVLLFLALWSPRYLYGPPRKLALAVLFVGALIGACMPIIIPASPSRHSPPGVTTMPSTSQAEPSRSSSSPSP